jgi:NNP family nitrate/nitrite transporter-like MFS transporter
MSAAKGAFVVFTGFYVVCAVLTWFVYLRRPAEVRATSLAGAGI